MEPGGNDIDSLKFGLVLDSKKFENDLKRVESIAKAFEKSVSEALAITNLLDAAQNKGKKAIEKKAKTQEEVTILTRQELEAKRAAGTITDKELKNLKQLVALDKSLLDEENKKLAAKKKQEEIEGKQLVNAKRRKAAEEETGEKITLNTNRLVQQSAVMKGLSSMVMQYVSVFGAVNLVRNLVRITGEFEAQHTALRAILQDAAAADQIFNQLQVLAVKSPFTFQNLVSYAKQLTAFSVPVNEVFETTKKLADVSAGLGVDLGRIILAYGQVRSAEFLRGQEVRQFTEAGIPILKELADQFKEIEGHAISVGEVFDRISARQVPFEMVEEAFNRMTSAGGKFYQMQEVLAETVKGKVSNLQDAWEIMLSRIGNEHSGTIKGIIMGVTGLLSNYERWIGVLGAIIRAVGLYSAAMITLNTITRVSNGIDAIRNGLELVHNQQIKLSTILLPTNIALEKISIANKKEEAAVITTLNLARKAGVAALAALGAIIFTVIQRTKAAREEANKSVNTINSVMGKLSATMADFEIGSNRVVSAFKKMKDAEGDNTEETKEFERAVDDLKKQFPKFIDDNLKLAETVDDLGKYWARARQEMNQYYADEARESIRTDLQQNREEETNKLSKKFTQNVKSWLPAKDRKTIGENYATVAWRYVTGDISRAEVMPIVSALNAINQQQAGTNVDYSGKILEEFDGFVAKYKAIMGRYNDALELTDDILARHNLSSTRQNFNEYIFSLTGAKERWRINGGEVRDYDSLSVEEQKKAFEFWVNNDERDLAFYVDDTVESWAERQREKLSNGSIPEEIKSVIRTAFEQFNIIEDPNTVTGWRKDVNDIIDNFGETLRTALEQRGDMTEEEITAFVNEHRGVGNKLKVKPTDQLGSLVDGWIKNLNETDSGLKLIPEKYQTLQNDAYAALWLDQLLYQSISSGLYGEGDTNFSGTTKDAKQKAREAEQERKERERKYKEFVRNQISGIKQQYQDLKQLKATYDEYKGLGFTDAQLEGILTNYYGRGIPEGGFFSAFEALAVKMDKYSPDDASDIRNFASGKDASGTAKKIEAAQRATKKFNDSVNELNASVKRLDLDGFVADLDKILVDTNAKNKSFRLETIGKLDEFAEHKEGWLAEYKINNPTATDEEANNAWIALYEARKKEIEEIIRVQTDYNNKVAQGQIDKKADDWVRTMLEENNIDLSDWSDKTLEQIDEIQRRLGDLIQKLPNLIPEELKDDANDVNVTFTSLLGTIRRILQLKVDDTDIERRKKQIQRVKETTTEAVNAANDFVEIIQKIGDASEDGGLTNIADGLSDIINMADKASGAYSSLLELWTKQGGGTDEARGIGKIAEGAIGSVAMMAGWISVIVALNAKVMELAAQEEAQEKRERASRRSARNLGRMQGGYVGTIFGDSDVSIFRSRIQQLDTLRESMAKYQDQVSSMKFTTKSYGFWEKLLGVFNGDNWSNGALLPSTTRNLETIMSNLGLNMFDEYGNLNADSLQKILESYEDLTDAERTWIEQAIQDSNDYAEAMQEIEGIMNNLFGNAANDMVDQFIDNFHKMGDAVNDFGDVFTNLGDTILRSLLQSYILDEILSKYSDEANGMMAKYASGQLTPDEYADWLYEFSQRVKQDSENQSDAINGLIEAFDNRGFINWDDTDSGENSLGNGIKGITEDTANLLASYLNAIRADVSYGRIQWERIAVAVEGHTNQYVTLNDYLAQVAANTFDMAQNTNRILGELQSVIGVEGSSGSVVRVQVS